MKIAVIGHSGCGKSTLACRIAEETEIPVLHLDQILWSCLFRILKRYLSHRGKTRSSMAEGCREKIDFEFFLWILYNGRKREKMKKFRFVCSRFGAKTVRIRNQRQLDRYYRRIADDF